MRIRDFFEGRDELLSEKEIIGQIREAPEFDAARETVEKAEALLLFQTSRQQTWLVSTEERLYCLLDDKSKREPELRWVVPRAELVDEGRFVLPIQTRNNSANTGLIDLGPRHANWYFSKSLFDTDTRAADVKVASAVEQLVTKKMLL